MYIDRFSELKILRVMGFDKKTIQVCNRNNAELSSAILMPFIPEMFQKISMKPSLLDSPATPPALSGCPTCPSGLAQISR